MTMTRYSRSLAAIGLGLICFFPLVTGATEKEDKTSSKKTASSQQKESHGVQRGEASYYGKEFFGRKMADGTKMNPDSNIAASKTLPLGTVAEVTNLENGKSEVVEIRDRGPYVEGRIVDVTPKTAEKLGFKEDGVAPVVVEPIDIPDSDKNTRD